MKIFEFDLKNVRHLHSGWAVAQNGLNGAAALFKVDQSNSNFHITNA